MPHLHTAAMIAAANKALKDAKDFAAKKWKDAKNAAAKAAKDFKDAAAKAIKDAAAAAAALAKKVALAALKVACKALQFTLDKVIATAVGVVGKLGVAAVVVAGKLVAKGLQVLGGAIDSIFLVNRMWYKGSLVQASRGNFGNMEILMRIFGKKLEIKLSFNLGNFLSNLKKEAMRVVSNIVRQIG